MTKVKLLAIHPSFCMSRDRSCNHSYNDCRRIDGVKLLQLLEATHKHHAWIMGRVADTVVAVIAAGAGEFTE